MAGTAVHASRRAAAAGERPLRVLLAAPRGFCAGVRRAIDAVEDAIARYGAPVYVRRPIVHNRAVMRRLETRGAIFVEELDEVPDGAVVIMSAHGISRAVAQEADRRGLTWFDAVCPLVSKVHREVARHRRAGRHVILIGHRDHPEIIGTLGQLPSDAAVSVVGSAAEVAALPLRPDAAVAYAVQTTYAVEEAAGVIAAIEARFGDVAAPQGSDICYATSNRQAAIREIAARVDAVIVAGADFSSNARRLAEVARAAGCERVQLVAEPEMLDLAGLDGAATVGITAAASTPEETVSEIVARLARHRAVTVEEVGQVVEAVAFRPVRIGYPAMSLSGIEGSASRALS